MIATDINSPQTLANARSEIMQMVEHMRKDVDQPSYYGHVMYVTGYLGALLSNYLIDELVFSKLCDERYKAAESVHRWREEVRRADQDESPGSNNEQKGTPPCL
ncbi:hypothetical protein [Pseudomonas fragariae (ex Marin et al. 2024)]|uniref:hypothetical protein n=1 Tax=Pseudomonas fragariae (ex Marin et al. 2024) TaxID=3080056 RepID=UPI003F7A276A